MKSCLQFFAKKTNHLFENILNSFQLSIINYQLSIINYQLSIIPLYSLISVFIHKQFQQPQTIIQLKYIFVLLNS